MSAAYDRTADLRALDNTCSGVRGLAASGITQLPRIFRVPDHHHESPPPQALFQESPSSAATIPVIDLGGPDRAAVVAAVRRAAAEWGFFQVTGHGVPLESMAAATDAARGFHEADGCEGSDKARLYSREPAKAVKYHCNFDLHQSPVANWRDAAAARRRAGQGPCEEKLADPYQELAEFAGNDARQRARLREIGSWYGSKREMYAEARDLRRIDSEGGDISVRSSEGQTPPRGAALGDGPSRVAGESGGEEVGGIHLLRDGGSLAGYAGVSTQIQGGGARASYTRDGADADCHPRRAIAAEHEGGDRGAGRGSTGDASPLCETCAYSTNSDAAPVGSPRRDRYLNSPLVSNRFWLLASGDSDDGPSEGEVVVSDSEKPRKK